MARQHYKENVSQKERHRFARFLAEGEELILVTGYSTMHIREIFIMALAIPGFFFMAIGFGAGFFPNHDITRAGYGLLIGLVIAGIVGFFKAYFVHHSHQYLMTTRRLIIKKGFFVVNLTSALYDKMTHIEVFQGFVDRFFMYQGKVIINTAGMNKGEITLEHVGYPVEFKNLLERLINREREQYGRPTGPVVSLEGELVED